MSRAPLATAALLAAFLTACAGSAQPLPAAGPNPSAQASALPAWPPVAAPSAAPAASPTPGILCPGASALEAKTLAIADHCVAVTVGILASHGMASGSGSGVLASADGLILTAGHVVDKPGTRLAIRLPDGRVVKGVALGVDRGLDSGMARITDPAPPGGWPFAPLAPADSAATGEWVLATGNPGGIVIGRNPPLRLGRVTIHDKNIIQSDCTVVSGDSGGPLFDLQGRVVGIHSNISLNVDENRHVPARVYHAQWNDLLAGRAVNAGGGMLAHQQGPVPADDLSRIGEALQKLAREGDAEARKIMADAKANGGKMKLDAAKAKELVARAKLPPKSTGAPALPKALQTPPKKASEKAPEKAAGAPSPKKKSNIPPALRETLRATARESLLQQFPEAKPTDAILDRILDNSDFDPATGHLSLSPNPEDLKAMGLSTEVLARHGSPKTTRVSRRLGEASLQALSLFVPALEAAGDCIVEIQDGGKPVLMGTVVDAGGWIVTKAGGLGARPSVVLADGRTLEAKVIGKDFATDLALLKVDATDLKAAPFATGALPVGSWLVSPVRDPNRPAVGLVSVAARPIPATFVHYQGEQKVMLGLSPKEPGRMIVGTVIAGLPAAAAGMKSDDEILALDGQPMSDWLTFVAKVKQGKPGQNLALKIRREGKEMDIKMTLGDGKTKVATHDSIGETDHLAGGKLSRRRSDFPAAIQHDAVVWADQCGGPLVDLRGQVVGVNIARYDRVCTFAIPADLVRQTVAKLRASAEAKDAEAKAAAAKTAPAAAR